MADQGRIGEINKRFDDLLDSLNKGLDESDRLKQKSDQSLDELHEAVRQLDEIAEPKEGSARRGRRSGRRVPA